MARRKPDDKSNVADKASEIAKNIWLAGVGAYGKAVDDAQTRFEKAGVEPPKLFKDLVKAGAALEEEARSSMEDIKTASSSVEERINRVRENFSLSRYARGSDLVALHQKVDKLSRQLAQLNNALKAAGVLTTAAKTKRKTPAKKATTSSKKKATPRKAPATRKSAAKSKVKTRAKAARKTS